MAWALPLALAASVLVAADAKPTSVRIVVGGVERGAFEPLKSPYTTGGPSVSVPVSTKVRTADGRPIKGFEFIGWRETAATRVLVFALVRPEERPGAPVLASSSQEAVRRDFDSFLLADGSSVTIEKMKTLGLEPFTIAAPARR